MDNFLEIISIICVAVYIIAIIADKVTDYFKKSQSHPNGDSSEQPDTARLMFKALSEIGCQPEKDNDGSINVQYQGETFHMDFGGMYARVWDPMWAGIKANDPDLPQIREAVNAANFNFGPTIVLTSPDENGIIGFHTRRDIMLHPLCPDNAAYVKAVLDSFFEAKEQVKGNFQEIKASQDKIIKKRRPIGFNTDYTKDEIAK
ncbi:MAG: hypothetical protein Q4D64_08350 [Prevotellaceae bacterium]|nr:hypothetical protein [Prevotellaceae bacterium]